MEASTSPFTGAPLISPFSGSGFTGISLPLGYVSTGLFWIAVFSTAVIAVILYYHWVRYGIGILGTMTVMVVYAIGVAVLLLAALGFLAQL